MEITKPNSEPHPRIKAAQMYKTAMEEIAANFYRAGEVTFFIYGGDILQKKAAAAALPKKRLPFILCPPPPMPLADGLQHAAYFAIGECRTEHLVLVDASKKIIVPKELAKATEYADADGPAWEAIGNGIILAKTYDLKIALQHVTIEAVPALLAATGRRVRGEKSAITEPSVTVLTLLGHESRVEPWFLYLQRSDIPKTAKIVIANNCSSPESFRLLAHATSNLCRQFASVEMIDLGPPYVREPGEPYIHPGKHIHVAELYNRIIPRIGTDLTLFLEHDVIPPADGFGKLMRLMDEQLGAAAAGVYEQPEAPHLACAARGTDEWTDIIELAKLPKEPVRIGMTGGGFTLYQTSKLKESLPFKPTFTCDPDPYMLGWDGTLGRFFHRKGWHIWLHPGVVCKHEYHRVKDRNERNIP